MARPADAGHDHAADKAAVLMVAMAFTGSLDEMTGSDGCHQLTGTIRDLRAVTSNIEEITATRTLCNALIRLAGN